MTSDAGSGAGSGPGPGFPSSPDPEDGEARDLVSLLVHRIRERTGNVLPRARHHFLEEIALRRAKALGFAGPHEWALALGMGEIEDEWEQLIPLITIKESFFFRAPQQFEVIERNLLPQLVKARAQERTLRIWCAASARGEEPATLALVLSEHPALNGWDWRILATDVDEDALATARRGLYGDRAVGQVPPPLLERWFRRRGTSLYELHPAILGRIDYRQLNLSRFPWRGLPEGPFDLILLRNVLIYFRRPLQRRVAQAAAERLAPDGFLFLGASETLWQIYDGLVPVDLRDCFAYRHPRPEDRPDPLLRRGSRPLRPDRQTEPAPPPGAEAKGSPGAKRPGPGRQGPGKEERKGRGAKPPEQEAEAPKPDRPPPPRGPAAVLALNDEPVSSTQELLHRAARTLAENRIEEAEALAAQAREADASEPAVYAIQGFLADLQGSTDQAVTAYRAALFLDPSLYQVRLLLADCLQRLGHRDRAEHEYREVLATLATGRHRELVLFEDLPFPERARAERRCRQVLGGG